MLSPTHLHEFKSADRIYAQTPIMSLYLPEQKLGSHSSADSSSHKFMLKGRQTGGLHRGHGWVFRAESYDTMLAWYEDMKVLTEKTGEERNAFVRRHARSMSGGSHKAGSISSEGALDEDEADEVPYSASASHFDQTSTQGKKLLERPQPGGRFPSDINSNRNLQVPLSPSSGTSSDDHDIIAAAGALPGSSLPPSSLDRHMQNDYGETHKSDAINRITAPSATHQEGAYMPITPKQEYNDVPALRGQDARTTEEPRLNTDQALNRSSVDPYQARPVSYGAEYNRQPVQSQGISSDSPGNVAYAIPPKESIQIEPTFHRSPQLTRPESAYGDWMAPVVAGTGVAAAGAGSTSNETHRFHEQQIPISPPQEQLLSSSNIPSTHQVVTASNLASIAPGGNEVTVDPTPSEIDAFGSAPRIGRQVGAAPANLASPSPADLTGTVSVAPVEKTAAEPPAKGVGISRPEVVGALMNETAESKPSLHSQMSGLTISDLHVPGEYPRLSGPGPGPGPNRMV